jgi:hypothetical protein
MHGMPSTDCDLFAPLGGVGAAVLVFDLAVDSMNGTTDSEE